MSQTRNGKEERVFTIELNSKSDVKNVSLGRNEKVLIEGSLGSFKHAHFVDDLVLEVIGSNGELRIDLGTKDLQKVVKKDRGSGR